MKKTAIQIVCCLTIACTILLLISTHFVELEASKDSIVFSKYITDSVYEGKNYTILTITAYPNDLGELLQTGKKLKAPYGKIKNFLFNLGIAVENVDETYDWITSEICSFIYIYDTEIKDYRLAASYNIVKSSVAASIPYLIEENGSVHSDIEQKKYGEWISDDGYGDITMAIKCFNQGMVYNACISNIVIKDCDGKELETVSLKHPDSAAKLGYKAPIHIN